MIEHDSEQDQRRDQQWKNRLIKLLQQYLFQTPSHYRPSLYDLRYIQRLAVVPNNQ